MKHRFETRVVQNVSAVDGKVAYYIEKRKWHWGFLPLEGWLYVSYSIASNLEEAEMLAIKILSNLTTRERENGKILWTSHNRETER
ncbi:hypothetical protein DRO27_03810 [Candidatus Bathyarchaeota archaeon]|nr:MAG: hypothetical protein DRO27_03810 [Candidatus Bathyarchaeota archaeon]